MNSILGFGILDTGRIYEIWNASRDKVISRGISMALMPIMEELIKDRLANFGFIKRYD